MTDARGHATGLHRQTASRLVPALDAREAGDALFRRARRAAIERLFVGTRFHAFAVAATTFLVHEDDSVFGPLVDGVARAGGEAAGIGAVIADARQIKEPCL